MNNAERAVLLGQLIAQYERESAGQKAHASMAPPVKDKDITSKWMVGGGRLPDLERAITELKRDLNIETTEVI